MVLRFLGMGTGGKKEGLGEEKWKEINERLGESLKKIFAEIKVESKDPSRVLIETMRKKIEIVEKILADYRAGREKYKKVRKEALKGELKSEEHEAIDYGADIAEIKMALIDSLRGDFEKIREFVPEEKKLDIETDIDIALREGRIETFKPLISKIEKIIENDKNKRLKKEEDK